MATAHDSFDKDVGPGDGEVESGSEKAYANHVDAKFADEKALPAIALAGSRAFQAPEFIRNMTPEERAVIENRLKWKIDLRLMPMITIM